MRFLLDLREKSANGRAGEKKAFILPEPLEHGQPERYALDNLKTRLCNPEWKKDVVQGLNAELITAVVALVQEKAGEWRDQNVRVRYRVTDILVNQSRTACPTTSRGAPI